MRMKTAPIVFIALMSPSLCFALSCQNGDPLESTPKDNPEHLKNAYFGEQHIHTKNSMDAFTGGVRMDLADTFEYAMGCDVFVPGLPDPTGNPIPPGDPVQRKSYRYDWVAITDHAEYLAYATEYSDDDDGDGNPNDPSVGQSATDSKRYEVMFTDAADAFISGKNRAIGYGKTEQKSRWQSQLEVIDQYNEPGVFTTLPAFEWTSTADNRNLHRNVFFRDKAPDAPFSTFDSLDPMKLWEYLEAWEAEGVEGFAITHNGNISDDFLYSDYIFKDNLSNDELVDIDDNDLRPMTEEYARLRHKYEPLVEIIQAKGQSETHPDLSPNDEFAEFELFTNLIDTPTYPASNDGFSKVGDSGYIRQALAHGLKHEKNLGVNPFKFGIVSGADSHSGISDSEENNYDGTHGLMDYIPEVRLRETDDSEAGLDKPLEDGTPGATGVWAEENTRDGIFDAMKQKETFGTSGPFMHVRFFGGWEYQDSIFDDGHQSFLEKAYEQGVPMGMDLEEKPMDQDSPTFAVWAKRDPNSGGLDRIQIIKVWEENGISREKIFEVVNFGDRKPGKLGKIRPLRSTVDTDNATYDRTYGAPELQAVWQDPYFDSTQRAAYYVRVLEIETPRWSTYDYVELKTSDPASAPAELPEPSAIQERAWSSPIWYTPAG